MSQAETVDGVDDFVFPADYGTDPEGIANNLFGLAEIGSDNRFNIGMREHPWYGLWDRLLRIFERSNLAFVCPQYPVWLREENMEEPIPGGLDPNDLAKFEFSKTVQFQSTLFQLSSPPASYSPPPSPLAHKSIKQPQILTLNQGKGKRVSRRYNITKVENKHKITDFSILHTILQPDHSTARRPSNQILNVLVPVVIEVKFYRCYANNNNHPVSIENREKMMSVAKEDVIEQIDYVFSQRRQPKALAIAAAGPFWCWRVFTRDVVPDSGHHDVWNVKEGPIASSSRRSLWSKTLLVGTPASNGALASLQNWVDIFVQRSIHI